MNYLELKNLNKSFNKQNALKSINLNFSKNEFVSILGPSGCGKTTILNLIAGILPVDSGQILLNGLDITYLKPEKRNIGFVFQDYALFPNLNVFKNISYGLSPKKYNKKERLEKVNSLIELVGLENLEKRYPEELSGGQKQRVALARALAPNPKLLLLDEPLSALDAKIRNTLGEELLKLQRKAKITTIMVTHDQKEALSLADRVILMNNGSVEQIGSPKELYYKPNSSFVADFLGHMNIIHLPNINNGKIFGIRYEEVKIKLASEEIIKEKNTFIGKVKNITFMGSFKRVKIMLNDFKTTIYTDLTSLENQEEQIKEGNLVAVTLTEKYWCQLNNFENFNS